MAFTTEFIEDGHGVLQIGSDTLQGSELIAGATTVFEKAKLGMPIRYAIVDLTNVEHLDTTSSHVRTVAGINIDISKIIGKVVVAVIAPSDAAFGMARMWEIYVNPSSWSTYVFRNEREAKAWLAARIEGLGHDDV